MANLRQTPFLRRCILGLATVTVTLTLTGCPDEDPLAGTPGSLPGSVTAPTLTPAAAQQQAQARSEAKQQAVQQQAVNQHAQKVQQVINQSEAYYNSGVANYNGNRLDAARLDFNAAVDGMLSSGLDLKNDPQMSDEFERLLSAINSLEMVALKQGNGFSPKVEPAPLDIAMNEVTFPSNPALVAHVAAELKTTQSDLPLVVNDYVAGFISYFSNSSAGHAHLKASLERAGKYKAMIQRVLRENGVPQDLIYQAVAESGFQPQALNARSGAGGMWQFMPFAGAYDLQRNGYFDERFDPEKSTIAYAKYMKGLYNQFGDWYLAMAAYDWGPGNVQRAVSRTGYADFWELYRHNALPAETKAYVPGIIAAAIMAKNPTQYGLTDIVPDAPVLSDTVTTNYAIDLRLVADLTESSVPEIVALNPALLRLSTPRDIAYDLHIPPGTRDVFLDRMKDIPEAKRASWRFHIVKPGETLDEIATSLHAHGSEIAEFNDVTSAQPIEVGDELIVPVATTTAAPGEQRYKVGKRDTLVTIADRYGVTAEQLRSWNHLTSNRAPVGRSIYVAEPVRLAPNMRASRSRRGRRGSATHSSSAKSSHAKSSSPASHKAATTTSSKKKKPTH